MAEIVNLNKARKARKARAGAQRQAEAAANRVKHGRTKAEKLNDARDEARRKALLDGTKKAE
jgi:hypothetical protein